MDAHFLRLAIRTAAWPCADGCRRGGGEQIYNPCYSSIIPRQGDECMTDQRFSTKKKKGEVGELTMRTWVQLM